MNFNTATLLRLVKKKIFILKNNKKQGEKQQESNQSQPRNTDTVWSNREFTNIVVAFVNDVAAESSFYSHRGRSRGNIMIRKKKKCVHYTQLEKDVSGDSSPIRSITPKQVKVNEVTREFGGGVGDHDDHDVHENHEEEDGWVNPLVVALLLRVVVALCYTVGFCYIVARLLLLVVAELMLVGFQVDPLLLVVYLETREIEFYSKAVFNDYMEIRILGICWRHRTYQEHFCPASQFHVQPQPTNHFQVQPQPASEIHVQLQPANQVYV